MLRAALRNRHISQKRDLTSAVFHAWTCAVRGDASRVRPVVSAMESLTDERIRIAFTKLTVDLKSSMRKNVVQYADDLRKRAADAAEEEQRCRGPQDRKAAGAEEPKWS